MKVVVNKYVNGLPFKPGDVIRVRAMGYLNGVCYSHHIYDVLRRDATGAARFTSISNQYFDRCDLSTFLKFIVNKQVNLNNFWQQEIKNPSNKTMYLTSCGFFDYYKYKGEGDA